MAREWTVPGTAHDVVDVAVDVHVDRVRSAGGQGAADNDRRHEPDRRDGACGEDHGGHGGHEEELDDPRLRQRDVGTDRVDRATLLALGDRHADVGAREAARGEQEPHRSRPQRGADGEVGHDEERRQA
jgi:hypothetical protein